MRPRFWQGVHERWCNTTMRPSPGPTSHAKVKLPAAVNVYTAGEELPTSVAPVSSHVPVGCRKTLWNPPSHRRLIH